MALFKIFKGNSANLGKQGSPTQSAIEGFCYFTTDDHKFYIDISNASTAQVGVNRIALNAEYADKITGAPELSWETNNTDTHIALALQWAGHDTTSHPLVLPPATLNHDGALSCGNQAIGGIKTFYNPPVFTQGITTQGVINTNIGGRNGIAIGFYAGDDNGTGIAIGAGGRTIIGSGESAQNLRTVLGTTAANESSEQMYIASDDVVTIFTNCQTIANRKAFTFGLDGNLTATKFTGALAGNATSASKLQTARTLTIGNKGKTFDGSGNVSWSLAEIGAVKKAGDSMSGALQLNTSITDHASPTSQILVINSATPAEGVTLTDKNAPGIGFHISSTTWGSLILTNSGFKFANSNFNGYMPVYASAFHGNADSATKLKTARTINGTSFDGTANITTASWGTARNVKISDSDNTNTGAAVSVGAATSGDYILKLPATIKATLSGNASTATKFASAQKITLTGIVTGEISSQAGWSIPTSIDAGKITNTMLAGSIANDKLAHSSITIAGNTISLGGSLAANTLRESLGLSYALHFVGKATVTITDGSDTNPEITDYIWPDDRLTGDVIIDKDSLYEYVWTTAGKWERLGGDDSYKTVQNPISSPSASGSATAFIDTISQNANGVITVTKKNVTFPTLSGGSATAANATVVGGVTVSGHAVTVSKKTLIAGSNIIITGATDKITIAASDTKVTQNAAITTDGEYPVILAYSTATTAVTNTVNKTGTLTYNPSTKVLSATTFKGALDGNAKTATTASQVADSNNGSPVTFNYSTLTSASWFAVWNGREIRAIKSTNVTVGNATNATALTTSAGSATVPIYFSEGKPVQCGTSLAVSVTGSAGSVAWNNVTNKPGNASQTAAGLMSIDDKKKLDGIAAGANNYTYTLPIASTTLGGVKTTSTVTSTSGYVACPIINGVVYYKDTNSTYTLSSFGITATAAQLNYCSGATSNIQTQLNNRLPLSGGIMTGAIQFNSKGNNKIYNGANDISPTVGGDLANLVIESSYGISFTTGTDSTYKGKTAIGFDCQNGIIKAAQVYGAVWNDYAEYRYAETTEPGRCVTEHADKMLLTTKRLQPGCEIISDTFGMAIGKTEKCQTPIATSGRVLAYPYEDRDSFELGQAVCSGPNGTVSRMTRDEIITYPERIIGTVSEIPQYETWGTGNVKVNGRIWIRIR